MCICIAIEKQTVETTIMMRVHTSLCFRVPPKHVRRVVMPVSVPPPKKEPTPPKKEPAPPKEPTPPKEPSPEPDDGLGELLDELTLSKPLPPGGHRLRPLSPNALTLEEEALMHSSPKAGPGSSANMVDNWYIDDRPLYGDGARYNTLIYVNYCKHYNLDTQWNSNTKRERYTQGIPPPELFEEMLHPRFVMFKSDRELPNRDGNVRCLVVYETIVLSDNTQLVSPVCFTQPNPIFNPLQVFCQFISQNNIKTTVVGRLKGDAQAAADDVMELTTKGYAVSLGYNKYLDVNVKDEDVAVDEFLRKHGPRHRKTKFLQIHENGDISVSDDNRMRCISNKRILGRLANRNDTFLVTYYRRSDVVRPKEVVDLKINKEDLIDKATKVTMSGFVDSRIDINALDRTVSIVTPGGDKAVAQYDMSYPMRYIFYTGNFKQDGKTLFCVYLCDSPPTPPKAVVAKRPSRVQKDAAFVAVQMRAPTRFLVVLGVQGWMMPGGNKDRKDKTLAETALRELKEESGIRLKKDNIMQIDDGTITGAPLYITNTSLSIDDMDSVFSKRNQTPSETFGYGFVDVSELGDYIVKDAKGHPKGEANKSFRGGTISHLNYLRKYLKIQ